MAIFYSYVELPEGKWKGTLHLSLGYGSMGYVFHTTARWRNIVDVKRHWGFHRWLSMAFHGGCNWNILWDTTMNKQLYSVYIYIYLPIHFSFFAPKKTWCQGKTTLFGGWFNQYSGDGIPFLICELNWFAQICLCQSLQCWDSANVSQDELKIDGTRRNGNHKWCVFHIF